MPVPEYVTWLRSHVGHEPLWLSGATGVVLAPPEPGGAQGMGARRVLLVRRSDSGAYALVSGIVDPGEHPADCIVREAMEEACVEVVVERLIDLRVDGPVHYANGDVSSYVDHVYRCRWVRGEPRVGDDEATEARWWLIDDLPPLSAAHSRAIALAVSGRAAPHLGPAEPTS